MGIGSGAGPRGRGSKGGPDRTSNLCQHPHSSNSYVKLLIKWPLSTVDRKCTAKKAINPSINLYMLNFYHVQEIDDLLFIIEYKRTEVGRLHTL
jgi:hypothetical protein